MASETPASWTLTVNLPDQTRFTCQAAQPWRRAVVYKGPENIDPLVKQEDTPAWHVYTFCERGDIEEAQAMLYFYKDTGKAYTEQPPYAGQYTRERIMRVKAEPSDLPPEVG